MIAVTLSALVSHWRRHPGQLGTLLIGLALATALWSGVQAINAEARASYAEASSRLGQSDYPVLERVDGAAIAQETYVALRRSGWAVTPVVEGVLPLPGARSVTILGLDPLSTPPGVLRVDLSAPEALLGFISDRVVYGAAETLTMIPEGVLPGAARANAGLPLGVLLADIGTAQGLLDMPGHLTRLLVGPQQSDGLTPLAALAPDLVQRQNTNRSDVAALTDSFHLNLTAFGLLAFAVGLFIVHAAIGLGFEQRRPMFRTLRALGVPGQTLTALLLAEVLLLSLSAGALGVFAGYGIAASLLPDVAATLRGLYGAEVTGTLSLRPSWWLSGLGIAVLGGLAAGGQSLWRVMRLPVLAPAQPRAWGRAAAKGALVLAGLAALCLLMAGVAYAAFDGLLAGFVMLAGLLVGAALLLPVVLGALLSGAARLARGAQAQWFWADTRQQLPGLSLALMALLLALATNIGVGTMVGSFRLTFTGWLDQRLVSEFYVSARSQAEADLLQPWLEARADAVLPIWQAETRFDQTPAEVFAVADHPTYRDNWPLIVARPDTWDRVAEGKGVLINEQHWRRSGLALGAPLPLPGGPLPIVGVYSDYGNPKAQALVSVPQFLSRFPDAARLGFGLRIDPSGVPALRAELATQFGLPEDVMIDQAAIKAFSLGVFERTFAVSAALNVLTLGVAGFAILTSLLTLATMRLPQLAPVWAIGMTRASLARLEFARALLLAALTAVLALPLGLALAWALLAVINVEAFGWRLPMHLFPLHWVSLGGLALLAAGLAALLPVHRLSRMAPIDLLKVFAHER